MHVTYGKSWFGAKKHLTESWEESRARQSHETRKSYVVLIAEQNAPPICFIEINNDYIGVGFLDIQLREYLSYQFEEIDTGRLFLSMATHREFDEHTDRVSSGTTYYFKTDGKITVETEDFATNTVTCKETVSDVAGNWELYPAFGDYASIARKNR